MPLRIILNFSITADGKISTQAKSPARFTSKHDLERLHKIRRHSDAILVGHGTLEADSMSMTTPGASPWRCVISRTGQFNPSHKLFHSEGGPRHLIITESFNTPDLPAEIHHCSLSQWLQSLEIDTLLCEGGGFLTKSLFALDLVDEINLTWAPHTLFGGKDAPTISGLLGDFLPASRHYKLTHFEEAAPGEVFLTYVRA